MSNEFDDVCIAEIRDWQNTKPFILLKSILEERQKEIEAQRLSRAYIEKENGILKLNYFLGYEEAVKDILDIMKFEVIADE